MARKYTCTRGVQGNVEGALLESIYSLITFSILLFVSMISTVSHHCLGGSFVTITLKEIFVNSLIICFSLCVYIYSQLMQNVGVSSMQISAQCTQRFWVLIKSTGKPWHLPQLAGPRHLHLLQIPHRLQITKFSTKAHFVDHCSEPLLSIIQLHLCHSPLQNLLTF